MIPANLHDFEALVKDQLSPMAYAYYASGADDEATLRENRAAFERIRLRPHYMRGVGTIDTRTTILGHTLPYPLFIAPMAFMTMAHPDGERAMARAAAKHHIPMILSTMANTSLEKVQSVANSMKFFQLYVYKDKPLTEALVKRADAAGYNALVLTIDAPVLGKRKASLYSGFQLPQGLIAANLMGEEMQAMLVGLAKNTTGSAIDTLREANLNWEHIAWLRSLTDMPIYIKGALRGDDAQLAIAHGVDGIIVSNHGGRQLDTAPATIDVLTEIVSAVNGSVDVLLDGGVRRGTDMIKALAMGAKAVLIGRPMLYALAYNGESGVNHALDLIKSEFETAMRLCGCRSLAEITPDLLMV